MSDVVVGSRRYPRRRLTGRVEVTFSSRLKYPKLHLVPDCEGLAATVEEARAQATFSSVLELALADWGRPCRMCALESVLIGCGDPRPALPREVFVTFTSQASPTNPDASVFSYDWHAATSSGVARLHRLARRLRLEVTGSVSGPVAFGMLSAGGASAVAANLRAVVKPAVVSVPSAELVQTLWTLLADAPPELAEALGEPQALDAWSTAVLLAR